MLRRIRSVPLAWCLCAACASAQSFNVDVGSATSGAGVPSATYGAAAGQPGAWNTYEGVGSGQALVDVTGAPTGVTLTQSIGAATGIEANAGTIGDDEALLDDFMNLGPIGTGHVWSFQNLALGRYALYTYAWPGDDGDVSAVGGVSDPCGVTPDPEQSVGGAWTGAHALGVTYAVHRLDVPSGGSFCIQVRSLSGHAQLNGFQLVLEGPATVPVVCAGDGSATACPCANFGLNGRGCGNSVNASGASLWMWGDASVSNDTLFLDAQWMPESASLLVEGTSLVGFGAGAVFGDGLRCVGGTVRRLGVHANSGGASRWPGPAELPLGFGGTISAGDTRNYQVWYRNAAPFCTSETFNLTNGLSVSWSP